MRFGFIEGWLAACSKLLPGIYRVNLEFAGRDRGPGDQRMKRDHNEEGPGTRGSPKLGTEDERTRALVDQGTRGPGDQRTRGPLILYLFHVFSRS